MKRKRGDPKRAVAYIRVSTNEQDLGPRAQRAEIGAYARKHGIRIVRWRVEKVSGKAPLARRPRLALAIRDLREVGAGKLLVWLRDRFIRADLLAIAVVEQEIAKTGGELWSTDGISNGDTPEAQFIRRVLDAANELERQKTGLRTALACAARTRRGIYGGGKPPFGWRRSGAALVPDPAEQAVVEMVRAMAGAGMGSPTIAGLLTADGVQCRGSRWHARTVRRILARDGGEEGAR